MTKLLEWVAVGTVLLGVWFAIVFRYVYTCCFERWMDWIIPSPIIVGILFGMYAAAVVLYRVFTFNDCQEAAKELKEQIIEARMDLKKKGYEFN